MNYKTNRTGIICKAPRMFWVWLFLFLITSILSLFAGMQWLSGWLLGNLFVYLVHYKAILGLRKP